MNKNLTRPLPILIMWSLTSQMSGAAAAEAATTVRAIQGSTIVVNSVDSDPEVQAIFLGEDELQIIQRVANANESDSELYDAWKQIDADRRNYLANSAWTVIYIGPNRRVFTRTKSSTRPMGFMQLTMNQYRQLNTFLNKSDFIRIRKLAQSGSK